MPGCLQVGLDHPAVVVEGAPPALREVLRLLDGCHSYQEIDRLSRGHGLAGDQLDALFDRLRAVGLLTDRQVDESPPRLVQLVGIDRLGAAVAKLLSDADHARMHLVEHRAGDASARRQPAGPGAEALRAQLQQHRGPAVRPQPQISIGPLRGDADLTVLTTDRLDIDRVLDREVARFDRPRLYVRGSPHGAQVGPLVLPGASACLRCTDLTRRDLDPTWPSLVAQLCCVAAELPSVLVAWAAATAASQVRSFLSGHRPETVGATVELSATDFLTQLRRWPPHADCGCVCRDDVIGMAHTT
jgi:hypothetical protein